MVAGRRDRQEQPTFLLISLVAAAVWSSIAMYHDALDKPKRDWLR